MSRDPARDAPDSGSEFVSDKVWDQDRRTLMAEVQRLKGRVAELEAELRRLRPPTDPLQDKVAAWIDRQGVDRHPSAVLLEQALGVPKGRHESEGFRRLARIMRRLGWKHSTNVPCDGGRVHGWIKRQYG